MMCYIALHSGHKCCDIADVSDEFRSNMTNDVKDLNEFIDDFRNKIVTLEANKTDFLKQIKDAETGVRETAEKLMSSVENHKQKLLTELDEIRKNRVKEIEVLVEHATQQKAMMASFEKYISEIMSKGTASDIARQANSLSAKVGQLKHSDETDKMVKQLGSMEVSFQASDGIDCSALNIVGKTIVKKTTEGLSDFGCLYNNPCENCFVWPIE